MLKSILVLSYDEETSRLSFKRSDTPLFYSTFETHKIVTMSPSGKSRAPKSKKNIAQKYNKILLFHGEGPDPQSGVPSKREESTQGHSRNLTLSATW